MKRSLMVIAAIAIGVTSLTAVSRQRSENDEQRRAAITLLRAINTAENAVKRSGKYVSLTELIEHPAMGRVKTDIAVNGNAITYHDAQVRLALSADATQYIVTVVGRAPSYTAAFSDEQGVIYTGKALE
jgi:hypothetical protein